MVGGEGRGGGGGGGGEFVGRRRWRRSEGTAGGSAALCRRRRHGARNHYVERVPGADVLRVFKVGRRPDHTPVDSRPPWRRLRTLAPNSQTVEQSYLVHFRLNLPRA